VFSNTIGTKGQGNVGVASAILYFTKQNYTVSIPLNDSQDYDLVVEINDKLSRVQVKTTKHQPRNVGIYQVSLKSSGGSRREVYSRVADTDVDYLFVLTASGINYLIPKVFFIKNKGSMNLNKDCDQFIVN